MSKPNACNNQRSVMSFWEEVCAFNLHLMGRIDILHEFLVVGSAKESAIATCSCT